MVYNDKFHDRVQRNIRATHRLAMFAFAFVMLFWLSVSVFIGWAIVKVMQHFGVIS